jgi:hypothetical protein
MGKIRTYNSTWIMASRKPTEFGFSYRWWIPRFVYSAVMHDLKYIKRNGKMIYKKAGYTPSQTPDKEIE